MNYSNVFFVTKIDLPWKKSFKCKVAIHEKVIESDFWVYDFHDTTILLLPTPHKLCPLFNRRYPNYNGCRNVRQNPREFSIKRLFYRQMHIPAYSNTHRLDI